VASRVVSTSAAALVRRRGLTLITVIGTARLTILEILCFARKKLMLSIGAKFFSLER
jgi:hypothetical protein